MQNHTCISTALWVLRGPRPSVRLFYGKLDASVPEMRDSFCSLRDLSSGGGGLFPAAKT